MPVRLDIRIGDRPVRRRRIDGDDAAAAVLGPLAVDRRRWRQARPGVDLRRAVVARTERCHGGPEDARKMVFIARPKAAKGPCAHDAYATLKLVPSVAGDLPCVIVSVEPTA